MTYVAALVIGYLVGSIPVSLLVARRHGVDLLRTGDGNPGAWNALEQLGPGRAWPAFAGDSAKGLVGGLVGALLAGTTGAYVGALGAMVGHALPAFARLRGGKAVMTFVGGALAFAPVAAGVGLAVCALVTLASRRFAWGARAGVVSLPLIQLAVDPVVRVAATGALMTLIGVLFVLRRPAHATTAPDAARTT